jgi:hypothetical protein
MAVIIITRGAHWRNTKMPTLTDEPRQFAHRWDPDEVEDVAHQAQNFKLYAEALGGFSPPIVLLSPPMPDTGPDYDHIKVNLSDWASIIETAMNMPVVIR